MSILLKKKESMTSIDIDILSPEFLITGTRELKAGA